ncbi:gtp-binding protein rheb [Anaeramoeba ignava]|uniref:Gtp-binding protein rheb n=1 Tax=Anaeramoeba ignava TaxID=1746090 RepID=A0A9Q0R482_ANAIG|nr:gtp-binding protein rheb [Anaeramoeba ignava]|eukprot:Anaeramoba_ignava/a479044_13.p1 GENE.a479044_13~~a479044_13.p1  ORF type:complete len:188 (-),score=50.11 a479044_13:22-585(-)
MSQCKQRKITLFGFRGVGKTAITLRFVQDVFGENYEPTIENNFSKKLKFNGENYELEIIDTPGQDEYTALSQNLILNTDGCIFVYTISSKNSFNMLNILRDKIIEKSGVTPMVLVGNKSDLEESRQVSIQEGQNLANSWKCPFFECSAKENQNISQTFFSTLEQIELSINPNFRITQEKKGGTCQLI